MMSNIKKKRFSEFEIDRELTGRILFNDGITKKDSRHNLEDTIEELNEDRRSGIQSIVGNQLNE